MSRPRFALTKINVSRKSDLGSKGYPVWGMRREGGLLNDTLIIGAKYLY